MLASWLEFTQKLSGVLAVQIIRRIGDTVEMIELKQEKINVKQLACHTHT